MAGPLRRIAGFARNAGQGRDDPSFAVTVHATWQSRPKLRVVLMPRLPLACVFPLILGTVSDYLGRVSGMAAPMSAKAWRCSLVGSARTGTVAGVPAKRSSLRVRVPRWASSPWKLR
jgi:hypothetical protein